MSGLTARLADFAIATEVADVPVPALNASRRLILDAVACAIAASNLPQAQPVHRLKVTMGGRPHATVVATGERLDVGGASYVNAQLTNLLDADESLLSFAHFASVVVMPAIAVGELVHASGPEVLAAVALGYDVAARIGTSLPNCTIAPDGAVVFTPGRGFSWASFGTAATVGRLLGLSPRRLAHAFGIVMGTAPVHGSLERYGTRLDQWSKYAMYGAIAEAGVNAAFLAQGGFRSDDDVLDEGSQFYRAFGAPSWAPASMAADVGSRWFVAEAAIKRYPFCGYGQAPIDMFDSITESNGLRPSGVDQVVVTVPSLPFLEAIVDRRLPVNPLGVLFSLPYALALVAHRVPAGPEWWNDRNLADDQIAEFSRRVSFRARDDWRGLVVEQVRATGFFPRIPFSVEVTTGTESWQMHADVARGDPAEGDPADLDALLVEKVNSFTEEVLGRHGAQALVDAADHLSTAPGLGPLVRAMVGPAYRQPMG